MDGSLPATCDGAAYEELDKLLEERCKEEKIENFEVKNAQYSDGTITFNVECDANKDEHAQKLPSDYVHSILND